MGSLGGAGGPSTVPRYFEMILHPPPAPGVRKEALSRAQLGVGPFSQQRQLGPPATAGAQPPPLLPSLRAGGSS